MSLLPILLAPVAFAADMPVTVLDIAGKPVADTVVTYTPDQGATIGAADRKGPFVVAQEDMQFTPKVLVIPAGATVNFPNNDTVSHHVYSFSPAKKFQLPLYGHGISRSMKFDSEGTVAIGCNIHDSMQAYIRVVGTPYFTRTDAKGRAVLKNLPDGKGQILVWHPLSTAKDGETLQSIVINAGSQPLTFRLKLRRMSTAGGGY
ncbi:hypothetical protein PQU92_09935 [Asticcacaulis sp. BYS171W]|uniref:Blue (type 1) copper domain-containing protein n=1 Tax=Asticcacaulis aquaticus TaxID=2984212 RepID=A0ABT5HU48_9CAUL|nr:plastocyanin/azurin family copper-binding protein [Asticcacaulis aquaticus]MDC7683597.1 hypothetical protein [Asticcacaulis aquaticus]